MHRLPEATANRMETRKDRGGNIWRWHAHKTLNAGRHTHPTNSTGTLRLTLLPPPLRLVNMKNGHFTADENEKYPGVLQRHQNFLIPTKPTEDLHVPIYL